MKRGRTQAKKEGYYISSRPPYGFDKKRDGRGFVLIPNEKEAEIVNLMYDKLVAGNSLRSIIAYLNDHGVPTRGGGKWSDVTLRQILRNPTNIGKIHSTTTNDIYEGKHTGIVSEDTFNAVQTILDGNIPKVKVKTELKNPLATILKCGCCGKTMRRISNRHNYESFSFKCVSHGCKTRSIACHRLETAVLERLKTELYDFNYILDNYEEEIKTRRQTRDEDITRITKALEKQNNALNVACEMLENGTYTIELFKSRTAIIEGKIKTLSAELEELQSTEIDEDERAIKAVPILTKVIEKYDTLTPKEKNDLLKKIIKRIDYTRFEEDFTLDIELLI